MTGRGLRIYRLELAAIRGHLPHSSGDKIALFLFLPLGVDLVAFLVVFDALLAVGLPHNIGVWCQVLACLGRSRILGIKRASIIPASIAMTNTSAGVPPIVSAVIAGPGQ